MQTYYTKAHVTAKQEDTFTAVASTASEDRQGEVVEVEGWDLKNFKDNPILLFMHDHTKPLGKATRLWTEKISGKPKLMFKGFISDATDYGRAAKQLMKEGILNSFSVGFRPIEMDGNVITKSELYEISLVSIPANPDARLVAMKSLQQAGIDEDIIKHFMTEDDEEVPNEELEELKQEVARLKDQVEIAVKGLTYLAPQRSKRATEQRLTMVKAIAKVADKLMVEPQHKTVSRVKIIKKSSETLIRELKGDL